MKDDEPPSPPRIPPKVHLHRSEKLGMPFLFILPVLALMGVFGPKTDVAHGRSGAIEWSAEFPARLRFENADRLIVRIQNRGQVPLPETRLTFDPTYLHAFAAVTFDPAPDTPYSIAIRNVEPGESRLVSVQLTADEYGAHQGWISLSAGGTETRIELSTFIFP